jgi:Fe-S-cluster-containing dehydrogenase component
MFNVCSTYSVWSLEAKKEGRRPKDGEIKTACAQGCPTNAIVFGDYNDPKQQISQASKTSVDHTTCYWNQQRTNHQCILSNKSLEPYGNRN